MAAMSPRGIFARALALILPLLLMLSCDGEDRAAPRRTPPVPKAAFKMGEIRGLDAQDRPEAAQRAQEEAARVVTLLNSYYNVAFIDPAKWQGGAHPELASLFSPDVHGQLAPQFGALALADLAPKLSKLTPSKQEAPKLTFLMEADLSAPHAVVSTLFEGNAIAKQKEESPVKITHTATFWLVREGDVYKIVGYKTNLIADTESKSASVTPRSWVVPR